MTLSPESRAEAVVSQFRRGRDEMDGDHSPGDCDHIGDEAMEALIAAAIREAEEAKNDKVRDFWRAWAAKRLDFQHRLWMRAAKRALDGDLRELRLRVDLAEAPPVAIVASTEHKD